jgi:hypothetical protein
MSKIDAQEEFTQCLGQIVSGSWRIGMPKNDHGETHEPGE